MSAIKSMEGRFLVEMETLNKTIDLKIEKVNTELNAKFDSFASLVSKRVDAVDAANYKIKEDFTCIREHLDKQFNALILVWTG